MTTRFLAALAAATAFSLPGLVQAKEAPEPQLPGLRMGEAHFSACTADNHEISLDLILYRDLEGKGGSCDDINFFPVYKRGLQEAYTQAAGYEFFMGFLALPPEAAERVIEALEEYNRKFRQTTGIRMVYETTGGMLQMTPRVDCTPH